MKIENPTPRTVTASVAGPTTTGLAPPTLLSMRNGAAVWGSDGELGPMLAIVVDPETKTATEIAVRNGDVPATGRMVPIHDVISATQERIDVALNRSEFFGLDRFVVPYRTAADSTDSSAPPEAPPWADMWFIRPGTFAFAVHENVPSGHVSIHRGANVFDASGNRAGTVEGWQFHPKTGQLASLVFAAHPLVRRRCVLVDASSVESIDDNGIRLTLSAADLAHLDPTGQ